MPVFLCYDPIKRTTPWTAEKYRSMTAEFAKRRIKYFSVSSPDELEEYLSVYKDETSSIVFFPANDSQRLYLFDRYGKFNINKIIFSHQDVSVTSSNFSSVMSDFYGDMELAISHLMSKGCQSIALFNANLDSYHDKMRVETYKKFVKNEPIIFTTPNKIYPSITELTSCDKKIDAIICVNDFVAFCLMLFLDSWDKNWREKLLVLGFSNSILSGLCSPSLSSISLNYTDSGKEVATIHKNLDKNKRMAYMHIVMNSLLSPRETTAKENPSGMIFSEYEKYDEETMQKIITPEKKCMALEKLLAMSDECDLEIMHGIIEGVTLANIASRLYLSRDTIKYRVKKIKDFLKFESTDALASFLRRWIAPQNLEKMIKQIKK